MDELRAISIGGVVAALALIACHFGFWGRLHPILAYIVGTLCLLAGITTAAIVLKQPMVWIVPWSIAGIGGATVVTLWFRRSVVEHWPDRDRMADRLLELTRSGKARKPTD